MMTGNQFGSWCGRGYSIEERGDGYHVSCVGGVYQVVQTWEAAVALIRSVLA